MRHFLQAGGPRQELALHFLQGQCLQRGAGAVENALRGGEWVLSALWSIFSGPMAPERPRWMALGVLAELSASAAGGGFLHRQAAEDR